MGGGQFSVFSCQLSVVSGQWSVVSGQWSVVSCQLSVVSCQLSVVKDGEPFSVSVKWNRTGSVGRVFFRRGRTRKIAENGGSDGGGSFQPRMTRITRMRVKVAWGI